MNKTIRGIYPVDELPTGLREALKPARMAEVTATALPGGSTREPLRRLSERLDSWGLLKDQVVVPVAPTDIRKLARPRAVTPRNAVRRVRRLRDKDDG